MLWIILAVLAGIGFGKLSDSLEWGFWPGLVVALGTFTLVYQMGPILVRRLLKCIKKS